MNGSTASAYAEKFAKVFDYIDRHLGEDLSVARLSRVANFSKFHFHRRFSAYAGVTVSRYIRALRLKRASHRLVFDARATVIDIALEAGFENPESFSRAFKNAFGRSPTRFRTSPVWQPWRRRHRIPARARSADMQVKIVDFKRTEVAALEHRGAPERLNDSVRAFIAWRKASGLSPVKTSATFGIAYHDPDTAAPEQFRFDICGAVTAAVPDNPQGVVHKVIPGGRCAVARHIGSRDRIDETVYCLYREWLPGSGEEPRGFPLFFHYLNLAPETPEHELLTDIYLPLK